MPESRKRPGHHDYQKPADIPSAQKIRGRTLWAVLLAVFGIIIAYFAVGTNYIVMAVLALIGAVIGYYTGKKMERM